MGWKEPEKKFCKECKKRNRESSIYKVHSELIKIKLPEDYNRFGGFEYFLTEKFIEVYICSNKHMWCELNSP